MWCSSSMSLNTGRKDIKTTQPTNLSPPKSHIKCPNLSLIENQESIRSQKVVFATHSHNSKLLTQLQVSEIKDTQKEQAKHLHLFIFRTGIRLGSLFSLWHGKRWPEVTLPVQDTPANWKQLYPVPPWGFCTGLLGVRCPCAAGTARSPYPPRTARHSCPPRLSPRQGHCGSHQAQEQERSQR